MMQKMNQIELHIFRSYLRQKEQPKVSNKVIDNYNRVKLLIESGKKSL